MARGETAKTEKETSYGAAYDAADFIRSVVCVLFVMLVILSVALRYATVEGESMEQTFLSGDRTLVSDLFYTPKRGDVVAVFEEKTSRKALIKRVIGLGGDVIDISGGVVYVNGIALDEPYLSVTTEDGHGDLSYPYTVPEGCIFVMGDNRNISRDSRYDSVGPVKESAVIGKVVLRFYPFEKFEFFI